MDALTGSNDLGTLGLGLLMAGAVAGLFSGVLGRGAGLILVSALFLVARSTGLMPDIAMRLAVGTTFAALVPLSLARAATIKPGAVARRLMLPVLAGLLAAAGLTLLLPLNGTLLIFVFAAGATAAAVLAAMVDEPRQSASPHDFGCAAVAFVGTLLAGLTGLSGTALTTPSLMAFGLSREKAFAIAAGYAIPITMAGALVALLAGWDVHGLPKYSYGYVNLLAFGVVAPVAFATNLIGAHYAELIDAKKLRWLFAAFVMFSVLRMIWSAVG